MQLAATPVEAVVPLLSARPSLGSSAIGLRPMRAERRVGVQFLAAEIDLEVWIEADDGAADIGQRRQVAARADGAALIDVRRRAGVQEGDIALDNLQTDAGGALHQRVGAQQHRGAHVRHRQTRPGGDLVVP